MIKKIFGKRNKYVNKDMVKVSYSNWFLKDEINKWLKYMDIESFNDVLINIGFKKGDCVYLDGIDVNKIYYSVNDEGFNKDNYIILLYGQFLESSPKIVISVEDKKRTYGFGYVCGEKDGVVLEKYEYLLDNGMICKRCYEDNRIFYVISNDKYNLLFNVEYDSNIEYDLNVDMELERYFGDLIFPIDIDSMYKEICEIISIDIDMCRIFELRVNEIDKYNHKFIRDIISLVNGNLVQFGMTKNGKRIFMDDDGNYSYELVSDNEEELKFKFSLDITDDNISYSVSNNGRNVIDDEMKRLVNERIDNANIDIEDSKKLVRKMFNGRWNN